MSAARNVAGTQLVDNLIDELRAVRTKGLDRAGEIPTPVLDQCLSQLTGRAHDHSVLPHHRELLLRAGIEELGEGDAAECAAVLFGVASHVRGLHAIELRKRAAELYYDRGSDRSSVEAFRKTREPRIIAALAAALLRVAEARRDTSHPVAQPTESSEFAAIKLTVNQPEWRPRVLQVRRVDPDVPGRIRELTWSQFGQGINTIRDQISHYGTSLDIDMAIGINEAGLMIATLLASANFDRCAIGYIRTLSKGTALAIDEQHSRLGPQLHEATAVMICDYEVKTSPVLGRVCDYLRGAGLPAESPRYFAVMGALATEQPTFPQPVSDLATSDLACQPVLEGTGLTDAFIGCLMTSPGIDPPLRLR